MTGIKEGDHLIGYGEVNTLDNILFFTSKGTYGYVPVYEVDDAKWKEIGSHINSKIKITSDEKITDAFIVKDFKTNAYMLSITRHGLVKKTAICEYEVSRKDVYKRQAIYMLSFGKSFRTNKDKEVIKFGSENLYIGGNYLKNSSKGLIEVAIGKNKKGIKVNKIHIQKIQELLGNLNVVIFSPEDLKLVKDGPRERRSFIDKEISQIMPKYYNYLVNYNKILIQRNKTLKSKMVDANLLSVYDENLANYGAYIYILRRDFIKKIAKISNEMHKKLTGNNEELLITYKTVSYTHLDVYKRQLLYGSVPSL